MVFKLFHFQYRTKLKQGDVLNIFVYYLQNIIDSECTETETSMFKGLTC